MTQFSKKLLSSDISVVIMGAIMPKQTKMLLQSIRKYLPDSQIILSTWENSDLSKVNGLYDILVLNTDPGAVIFDIKENKPNNLNRILVSSKSGIEKATRKYTLRLRSDLILKNDNILGLKDNLICRNPKFLLFKQKIFSYDCWSKKYIMVKSKKQRELFQISDWLHFGLTEDIRELFNIPLVKDYEFSRYFEINKLNIHTLTPNKLWAMSPEQYITSCNAKKIVKNFNFKHYCDNTDKNVKISEEFIINNFRVFSQQKWGIDTQNKKYKNVKMSNYCNPFQYYSEIEQLKDYKKYCDKSIEIKGLKWQEFLYSLKYYDKLKKHFIQLFYLKKIYKKPEDILGVIIYLIKFIFVNLYNLLFRFYKYVF